MGKRIENWGRALAALLMLLCLAGCGARAPVEDTFFAMDTVMALHIYGGADDLAEAEALIDFLEAELSATDPSSALAALNREGRGPVGPDVSALLEEALALCGLTDGALDVTIYPVVKAWGFTTGEYDVPGDEALAALLERVDHRRVALDRGAVTLGAGQELDLGAVAKGYTGDRVVALLRDRGVKHALLDLGGNVQTLGTKPDGSAWRVAVRDPFGDGYVGVVGTADEAVITSGGYERYFERDGITYHHIIDPRTGAPADSGLASVTVVGGRGVVCDGLSTALFVLGAEAAERLWREGEIDVDFLLVGEDGSLTLTEGLAERFAPAGDYANAAMNVLRR